MQQQHLVLAPQANPFNMAESLTGKGLSAISSLSIMHNVHVWPTYETGELKESGAPAAAGFSPQHFCAGRGHVPLHHAPTQARPAAGIGAPPPRHTAALRDSVPPFRSLPPAGGHPPLPAMLGTVLAPPGVPLHTVPALKGCQRLCTAGVLGQGQGLA